MQAPTTPSGAPAKEPGQRACPGCGAANGAVAAFCWQCYRPFGMAMQQESAPPIYRQAGLRGAVTEASVVSAPPTRPGRSITGVAVSIVVSVAIAAGLWFFLGRGGPDVELPQGFGGLTKVEGAQADLAREEFLAEAEREGGEGDVGLYGTAGVPSAALIWVIDGTVSSTEEAFEAFAAGANSVVAGSIDPTRRSSELVEGVQYVCASVGSAPPVNICMWAQDDVYWILADMSGTVRPADSRDLAVAAHDATTGA